MITVAVPQLVVERTPYMWEFEFQSPVVTLSCSRISIVCSNFSQMKKIPRCCHFHQQQ